MRPCVDKFGATRILGNHQMLQPGQLYKISANGGNGGVLYIRNKGNFRAAIGGSPAHDNYHKIIDSGNVTIEPIELSVAQAELHELRQQCLNKGRDGEYCGNEFPHIN